MGSVTTTRNGFRVEDITYRKARQQSAILDEMENEEVVEEEVKAPVSLTPEQIKMFYVAKIAVAKDSNEKRVYAQTIKWIDEMLETKKKLIALEAKEVSEVKDETGIEEDNNQKAVRKRPHGFCMMRNTHRRNNIYLFNSA